MGLNEKDKAETARAWIAEGRARRERDALAAKLVEAEARVERVNGMWLQAGARADKAEAQLAAIEAARREPVAWKHGRVLYAGKPATAPLPGDTVPWVALYAAPPLPPDCVTREKAREMMCAVYDEMATQFANGLTLNVDAIIERVEREVG